MKIGGSLSVVNNQVLKHGQLVDYFDVLLEMNLILHHDHPAFRMLGNVATRFRPICCVYTNRQIASKYGTHKRDAPLWRVETNDIEGGVLGNTFTYQCFSEVDAVVVVLRVVLRHPLSIFSH